LATRGHVSFLKRRPGTYQFTSILNGLSIKLGDFLRIRTKVLMRLHAVKGVNGAIHSQKDSEEANVGGSLAEKLTTRVVLLVGSLKPAHRPGIFAILDFLKMGVPLIGYALARV